MSQDYVFNFSQTRPSQSQDQDQDQQHQNEQIRRESLVGLEDVGAPAVYEAGAAGMLSEMFNFQTGSPGTELLQNQMNYQQQHHRRPPPGDWYGNSNSAEAMQLFLMNPSHEHHHHNPSTLRMLLPNIVPSTLHHQQSFGSTSSSGQGQFGPSTQFTWVPPGSHGLSLSLSSSLEAAKVEELRISDTAMLYFNQGGVTGQSQDPIHVGYGSSSAGVVKALRSCRYVKAAQELLEEFCSVGRAGQLKINKSGSKQNPNQNPSNSGGASSASLKDLPPLSSAERIEHQRRKTKLLSMLDEVDRRYNHYFEQLQMVVNSFDLVLGFGAAVPYTALAQKAMSRHFRCLKDAIAAQLKQSCELLGEKDVGVTKGETPRLKMLEQSLRQQRAFHQMEPEAWRPQRGLPERSVNILRAWLFEHFLNPYPSDADKHLLARQTGLSRNQVSNWFINARVRLWKPMVEDMYQQESKEESDNQSPHHQNQDQDHNDDEYHEEQQEEHKENTKFHKYHPRYKSQTSNDHRSPPPSATAQTPPPPAAPTYTRSTTATHAKRSEINDSENDPSLINAINTQQHCFSESQATSMSYSYSPISNPTGGVTNVAPPPFDSDTCRRGSGAEYRTTTGDDGADIGSTLIRFGSTSGDVSLTLGLRHAGNLPEKTSFFS